MECKYERRSHTGLVPFYFYTQCLLRKIRWLFKRYLCIDFYEFPLQSTYIVRVRYECNLHASYYIKSVLAAAVVELNDFRCIRTASKNHFYLPSAVQNRPHTSLRKFKRKSAQAPGLSAWATRQNAFSSFELLNRLDFIVNSARVVKHWVLLKYAMKIVKTHVK